MSLTWPKIPKTGFLVMRLILYARFILTKDGTFDPTSAVNRKGFKFVTRDFVVVMLINPHLPSIPVHPYQLDKFISNFRVVRCVFFIFSLFRIDILVSKQ